MADTRNDIRDVASVALTEDRIAAWRQRIRSETFAGYHFAMGEALETEGSMEAAVQAYRRALEIDPHMLATLYRLGHLLRRLGQDGEAQAIHAAARGLDPHYEVSVPFRLGFTAYLDGNYPRAADLLRAALTSAPQDGLLRAALGMALERTRSADAEGIYPDRLDPWPGQEGREFATALHKLAAECYSLQAFDAAERRYHLAVQVDPDSGDGWAGLGASRLALGRYDDALLPQERAVLVQPEVGWFWSHLGLLHLQRVEPEVALRCLAHGLRIAPTHGGGQQYRCMALVLMGRPDEAVEALRGTVETRPTVSEFRTWFGVALQAAGRPVDAAASYAKAVELASAEPARPELVPVHAICLSNFGLGLQAQGRLDEAEAAHRQALARCPRLAWVHTNLALVLGERGRAEEAAAAHRAAHAAEPHRLRFEAHLRPWARERVLMAYRDLGLPGFS